MADADQGQRLSALEEHARSTETQLGELSQQVRGLASVQSGQSAKLDEIAKAVTRQEFAPRFDFAKSVSVVRDIFAILSIIGGLSIWLVLTLTAADNRVTDTTLSFILKRMERTDAVIQKLESRLDWGARTERATP